MKKIILNDLYQPESIRNFNRQIKDEFIQNIEILERELLQLTELLIIHNGNLPKNNATKI